ncbi:DUF3307 domain-containing protein [Flagellimonas flava]|uniref:DUF3307 domain-containing protein n=1 Tax=Flagellimonas flava TaxID=570519 RepID=UPI003D65D8C5
MTFALILVAHWLGDYLFQTSNMAVKKSSSLKWLTAHVLTYSLVLGVFAIFLFPLESALIYVALNALLHFVTDFFTSKLASKYQDNPRVFYPVLGFDQMVHGLCLYLTYINIDSFF